MGFSACKKYMLLLSVLFCCIFISPGFSEVVESKDRETLEADRKTNAVNEQEQFDAVIRDRDEVNKHWEVLTAAGQGDVKKLAELIKKGYPLKAKEVWNFRDFPIIVACDSGSYETVRLLIDNGADVNRCDEDGYSVLEIAAVNKNNKIFRLLLERGALIERKNAADYTLLSRAAYAGNLEAVETLLKRGVDPNEKGKMKISPLMAAAFKGRVETVTVLVENGAEINEQIHLNDGTKRLERVIVRTALEPKIICEYPPPGRTSSQPPVLLQLTPLKAALINNHVDVVDYLISKGAEFKTGDIFSLFGSKPQETVKMIRTNGIVRKRLGLIFLTTLLLFMAVSFVVIVFFRRNKIRTSGKG